MNLLLCPDYTLILEKVIIIIKLISFFPHIRVYDTTVLYLTAYRNGWTFKRSQLPTTTHNIIFLDGFFSSLLIGITHQRMDVTAENGLALCPSLFNLVKIFTTKFHIDLSLILFVINKFTFKGLNIQQFYPCDWTLQHSIIVSIHHIPLIVFGTKKSSTPGRCSDSRDLFD